MQRYSLMVWSFWRKRKKEWRRVGRVMFWGKRNHLYFTCRHASDSFLGLLYNNSTRSLCGLYHDGTCNALLLIFYEFIKQFLFYSILFFVFICSQQTTFSFQVFITHCWTILGFASALRALYVCFTYRISFFLFSFFFWFDFDPN